MPRARRTSRSTVPTTGSASRHRKATRCSAWARSTASASTSQCAWPGTDTSTSARKTSPGALMPTSSRWACAWGLDGSARTHPRRIEPIHRVVHPGHLRREIDGWRQHSRQENQAQRRDRRGERTRRREAIERRREPAWHHITVKSGGKEYLAYHGNGNGGQLLRVVPQFGLAVMFTAGK